VIRAKKQVKAYNCGVRFDLNIFLLLLLFLERRKYKTSRNKKTYG
jgi:hypothetical protein